MELPALVQVAALILVVGLLLDVNRKLRRVLKAVYKRGISIMQEMDDLVEEVTNIKGTVASAKAAIAGLRQQLTDAGADPAKLKALRDSLKESEDDLAAAVAAPGT